MVAVFGINSSGLNTAIKLLVLLLVVIWLALVLRTFTDARRRLSDPILIGCAVVAAIVFPFIGTLIYTIVRPPEYLDDVREREMEMQAAEARLAEAEYHFCPHCDYQVERDFLRCPSCLRKLKDACVHCAKPLDPEWKLCPYCEHEIAGVTPRPRRRRPSSQEEQTLVTE